MGSFEHLFAELDLNDQIRGRQFEEICQYFLRRADAYKNQLTDVWLWKEWPDRWAEQEAGIDLVARMADIAVSHGCRLTLENESDCWGNTGAEAYDIIRAVGPERLSLCWDPGNSARAGDLSPFAGEYQEVKDQVSHVHMKNFDPATDSWSLMDRGVVDWPRQLEALSTDGYDGFIVIETHLHVSPDEYRVVDRLSDLESNTLRNLRFVQSCLKK